MGKQRSSSERENEKECSKRFISILKYLDTSTRRLRPFSEQQTDALAVMRPADALCDRGAHIDRHQLLAQVLVLLLWNCVRDLTPTTESIVDHSEYRYHIPPTN